MGNQTNHSAIALAILFLWHYHRLLNPLLRRQL